MNRLLFGHAPAASLARVKTGPAFSGIPWVVAQRLLLAPIGIDPPLWQGQWPKLVSVSIGGATFLCGEWTGLCDVDGLGRHRAALSAPRADSKLVPTGINALIRHPLCAAMMAMGAGWDCLWRGDVALVIAGVFNLFLHAKARYEESLLAARFEDYPRYASSVPRYIPGWPKSRREIP